MDILHAYWRMDYVTSEADPEEGIKSPFSDLPQLGDDRKALIVHRAEHTYLVLNRYPYNPGHILVVPFREVPEIRDLDKAERLELMDMIVFAQDILTKAMKPNGFNVGFNLGRSSGAGIPKHLHCHVVPRWNGDSNFLPVIGKTRSLPQALDQTWEVLTKQISHA
ncbi:HIT domain-containing protein [Puniceicoccales bacterium CK1056]|uniref:HIT domain-containing protein n=2 Tax=Oceanipulchritudo coccoides TaxID=2706888 RepID=A0A6B2M3C1_9BACT|nr:HIT domain-containing protein [Oceanipulchritudo coccoides]